MTSSGEATAQQEPTGADVEVAAERLKEWIHATITMISVVVGLSVAQEVGAEAATVTVGTAALFAWGCVSGLRMGGGLPVAVFAGTLDTAIGMAVAAVKLTAGH